MSSRLTDSLELCYEARSALKEVRADHGELESVLDGIFNGLPATIEHIVAHQHEAEQTTDTKYLQDTDRFRQQIAAVVDQLTLVQRDQADQADELQSSRERNSALSEELADQTRQTQHWQEIAQQKLAEVEAIAAQQRAFEQTTAANHRRETDEFRQQIAELAGQQALVERDQTAQAARLQSASERTSAMAMELADQKRQTQHWQEVAQQRLAEAENIAAHQREVEQTTTAGHQQETDQFRRQIAVFADQQTLAQAQQAAQAADLQSACNRNATISEELADQKCQTQHWQEMARQKLAEIEEIAAHQREVERTTAATHQRETDQLRQTIAALTDHQTLAEAQQAAQAAELQSARERNSALSEELADQNRQSQHWQQIAQQKLAELDAIAAQQREFEQTTAANHRQEIDEFRQQIAELAGQQALVERDQAAQAAELQSARERNAALAKELADQKHHTQHWQEAAQQKLAEAEEIAGRQREAEQTAAANHQHETDLLRQQNAALIDQQTLADVQQAAQAAELQSARERTSAILDELADQKRQTQHWQEMAQQKLAEVEEIAAQQREDEQTTAATHQHETDQLRQQNAALIDQQTLADVQQAAQAAELQSARERTSAILDELADQKRQTQHWQEMAQQKLAEVEEIAAQQREDEQTTAATHQHETDQLRQQIAALVDQQARVERELLVPPAELQAAREQNATMAEELTDQKHQTQHWQEVAQRKLAEIEGITAHQWEVEQTAAFDHQQETDQFRQQIAELIDQQALVKREQAIQAVELQAAREQSVAMAGELADQKRQAQYWQEMANCAKQVNDLRALFEHRQACQQDQAQAADDEAAARSPHSADLGSRLDRREDSSRLQPTHSDPVGWQTPPDRETSQHPAIGEHAAEPPEGLSAQDRLMAQHQAQWEKLLRTRSRAQK